MSPTSSTMFISEFIVGSAFGIYLISLVCNITEICLLQRELYILHSLQLSFNLGLLLSTNLRGVIPNYEFSFLSGIVLLFLPFLVKAYLCLFELKRWNLLKGESDKSLTELIKLKVSPSEAIRDLSQLTNVFLKRTRNSLFQKSGVQSIWRFFILISIVCQFS